MSLIAEALRKSEAERRRGQVPSLVSLENWTPRPRRHEATRGPAFVAGVVVVLLAIAAATWWFLPSLRERLAGAPAAPAAAPVAPAAAMLPPGDTANPPAPASTTPAPMPTVDARPSDRVTSVAVTSSAPPALEPIAPAAPARPGVAPAGPAAAATAGAAPSTPAAAVPTPPLTEAPERSPAPPSPYERVPSPAATAPIEPVAGLPAPPAVASDHVPSLLELSDGQRAGLPALKLNMHVYAKDPGNRFVLVNGNRLGEGESGSDGVRVVEIRPDGVVIDAKSVRVFLPRG